MKKILLSVILILLLIPKIVFASDFYLAPTLVKFWEDTVNEYYTYDYLKDSLVVGDDNIPLVKALDDKLITIEDAMRDIDKIYSKKRNLDDLIIPSNFIKYSIRGDDDVLVDYYLYSPELDNKNKYCDKKRTICFESTNKTLTLNNFKGENLYINDVDINSDGKFDELKIIVNGSNTISSADGDIAVNINSNPVSIGQDPTKEYITPSLLINSGSIGIYTRSSLTLSDLMVNITITLDKDTSDAYGISGTKAKLNLNNTFFNIDLELKGGVSSSQDTYGAGLGLINSSVDIKDSIVIISSVVNGVIIENENKENFNLDKDSSLAIFTEQETGSNLEDLAFSLKNVSFNNKGVLAIEDNKNSSYSVNLENVEFNSDYAVAIYSNALEAALHAKLSKLIFNGEGFLISNNREEKNNEVNSMLLDETELEINKDLKKSPSKFSLDAYNCAPIVGSTCKTGTIYTDNKIRALPLIDKLVNEEKDITVYPPEKVDKSIELNVQDETSYDEDWLIKFNDNLDKLTMLKIYNIKIKSLIDEKVILDDGNYKIYVPIPDNTADYEGIAIHILDYDQNNLSKEIKYTKSKDEKYYVFEVTKAEMEKDLEIAIMAKDKPTKPKYTCKFIDGKYYSEDGSVVDKKTYEKVCGIKDNPHTGIALPILFLVTLGVIGLILIKNKKKDFFKKI